MKIEFDIINEENIMNMDDDKIKDISEIFNALITTGGLTGVKGGQTIIHFDGQGIFQKVELKYCPWIRRKK